jgi:hypothetical protein
MRHPFFNLTHLVLRKGESDFHAQHQARGLVATLGPNAAIFARPGTTVSRGPGAKTLARQTPHRIPKRGWFGDELIGHIFVRGNAKLCENPAKSPG